MNKKSRINRTIEANPRTAAQLAKAIATRLRLVNDTLTEISRDVWIASNLPNNRVVFNRQYAKWVETLEAGVRDLKSHLGPD
jgi:hypothetical protein